MTKRSIEVFKTLKNSEQKFEYFMLGMTVALFAYIGEKYTPQPISFSQNTFELSALLLLVISIIVGFKRIEMNIVSQRLNYNNLHSSEKLGSLKKALLANGHQIKENGDMFNLEKAVHEIKQLEVIIPSIDEKMKNLNNKGMFLYRIRNLTFLFGFALLAISKVIGAYTS